jgi:hypothetical protein
VNTSARQRQSPGNLKDHLLAAPPTPALSTRRRKRQCGAVITRQTNRYCLLRAFAGREPPVAAKQSRPIRAADMIVHCSRD